MTDRPLLQGQQAQAQVTSPDNSPSRLQRMTTPLQLSGATVGPLSIPESFPWLLSCCGKRAGRWPGMTFTDFTEEAESNKPTSSDLERTIPLDGALHIRLCAQKGQWWAILGIFRLLSIYILFPLWVAFGVSVGSTVISKPLAHCSDPETQKFGLASAVNHDQPMFFGFILVYFPTFFYLQSKCLQAVLGTQLKSVDCTDEDPKIIGSNYPPFQNLIYCVWKKCLRRRLTKERSFWLWFGSVSIIPFFARHMAFMWNAEVFGMVWKGCDGGTEFQDAWASTMEQSSIYRYLCWFFHTEADQAEFKNYVLLAYGIVAVQFVFALAATVHGFKECCAEKLPNNNTNTTLRFRTWYDSSGTNNLAVLMHQADIACFDAVTDLQQNWELGRLKNFNQLMEEKPEGKKGFDDLSREEQIDYLYSFLQLVQRMVAKFALAGLAQNVVSANIQISFTGLLIQLMGFEHFWKSMYMVFVNVVMCLVGTLFAFFDLLAIWKCHQQFKRKDININTVRGGHATRLYDRIRRLLYRRLPFYAFLYVWITAWNLWKFAALFYCPSHLLNVPACVELP